MNLQHLASNVGLLGYSMASVGYLIAVQGSKAAAGTGLKVSFSLFALATTAVSVALATVATEASLTDMSGLLLTTAIGWIAIGAHLQFNMRLIGAFVAPLATLILLVKFFLFPTPVDAAGVGAGGLLLNTHITLAVVGQAFGIIASGVSLLYLWQQNLLKKKMLNQLNTSLPAIDRLGRALTFSLWAGFSFLTAGLLSGAWFTQLHTPSPELKLGWKVAWALAVWLWYLATLLAKNVFNRPSKRIAQMSLAGFVLLAMTYFGMGVFKPLGGG